MYKRQWYGNMEKKRTIFVRRMSAALLNMFLVFRLSELDVYKRQV